MKQLSKFIVGLLACLAVLVATPALAQETGNYDPSGKGGLVQCGNKANDPCTVEDIFNVFIIGTNLLIGLVSLFTIYAMFSAGFTMATSAGSAERLGSGKKQLVNALIGMLLVFLAFMLANTIVYVLIGARRDGNIFTNPLQYIGLTGGSDPGEAVPPANSPSNQR